MKRLSNIFAVAAVSLMLTGCGLYDKYEQKVQAPADAFGQIDGGVTAGGSESIAQLSWREFFTDPQLQALIEQMLAQNTDMNTARITLEKSETSLKMARMAYLPSLYFSPQGTLAKFDDNPWSKTYNLPLCAPADTMSWAGPSRQPYLNHGSAVLYAAGARPSVGYPHYDRQPLECLVGDTEDALGER